MRRLQISAIAALYFLLAGATAVAGGGSWLESYSPVHRPGETVFLRGVVSPGSLGTLEDGPFHAYLRVDPQAAEAANSHTFPNIHASDLYLGELRVVGREGWTFDVSITVNLPADLTDGGYEVVYCNDPCTAGLGDLLGAWLNVRTPPPPRPAYLIAYAAIRPV